MIDYEKLKQACELAGKLTEHQVGIYFNLGKTPQNTDKEIYLIHPCGDYSGILYFDSIDDLITKIKDLISCEHESNGKLYGNMELGAPGKFKCKKCGELYE